jgi:nitrogen-specific signal transduction histidine kinase
MKTRPTQSPKLDASAGVSERSLSRLTEIVTEAIAVCDDTGQITLVNAAQRSCLATGAASCAESRLKCFCQSAFDTIASI